jgi:phage-related protein
MAQERGWSVESFRDRRGRRPVDDFIRTLQPSIQSKLARDIDLLRQAGPSLGMPQVRPLAGHGFSELRTQSGRNLVRVFFFITGNRIVLLHAFTKKTQATPRHELQVAAIRQREYMRG